MKSFEQIQHEAQIAKLRGELGDVFAQWVVGRDRAMFVNPIDAQRPPPGWGSSDHGRPGLLIAPKDPDGFRAGMVVHEDAHSDLVRELRRRR